MSSSGRFIAAASDSSPTTIIQAVSVDLARLQCSSDNAIELPQIRPG